MIRLLKKQTTRLIHATGYSVAGLKVAYKTEPAFVLEIFFCIVLIPLALVIPVSLVAKALLISSLSLVLIVELMNSAIEAVVDRISEEKHPLSKKAKDLGSAAVFVALVNVVMVWCCILMTMT